MSFVVQKIKKGILRIIGEDKKEENYLERYGIVNIPESDGSCDAYVEGNTIKLPWGKDIEFCVRDENGAQWQEIEQELNEKFGKTIPHAVKVEGRPDGEVINIGDAALGKNSAHKFGINFEIGRDEFFYGLGEGARDRISLRGYSYQNWTIYQYNEIPIPLVMSSDNWGIFINAQGRHFVDIDNLMKDRLTILGNFDDLDIFVLYGESMKTIIRHYTEITGQNAILPKWAYGLTYIAGIHQNQFEILQDMTKFREKHIPCDTVSLEPGWMTKHYDYSFDKEWNEEMFHICKWMRYRECPYTFPSVLRRFGFHTMLWMCVNYDLCDREERLVTGKGELPEWYEHVKQFVNDGIDGFKMDPADMVIRVDPNKIYTNGMSELDMHSVSQVLVLKQMYQGFAEQMNMRPFIHYCGGYTGQQHWGAATTGDNGGLKGGMIWLLNLSMSGFMNVTVDMDIYNPAAIHFAMLAPWAHHNAWQGCGQPWYAGSKCENIYIYYAKLRYRLIPYLYSHAIECYLTGVPIIRPMPLEYQPDLNCRELTNQYMLGGSILLSAFTDKVYLPDGVWVDYWTGEEYAGRRWIEYAIPEDRGGAFFIKKGAIIPMWHDRDYTSQYTEEKIELHFYPHGKTAFVFREDDGISEEYKTGRICETEIICEEKEDCVYIKIGNRNGDYNDKPKQRFWEIFVHQCDKKVIAECSDDSASIVLKK